MAIDKDRTKEFIEEVKALVPEIIPDKYKDTVVETLLGPVFKELEKLVDKSRPPVFYLVGRSGHGKSSLTNALANKEVTDVGDVKPTTSESTDYLITFPEQNATWRVIDSRGLFETTPPEGEVPVDTVEKVKEDIKKYNPDIIFHVISAPEIRNLSHDIKIFKEIMEEVQSALGIRLPVIEVLTKCDTLGNPREWPPEEHARKAGVILEALEYLAKDVHKSQYEFIDKNIPYKGFLLSESNNNPVAIIPVSSLWEDLWNIETLDDLIINYLPESALLDYVQAQKRKALLKKISSSLIERFSLIAELIDLIPIPIADIFVLTPLQMLLIAIIGGLSCRKVTKETVEEFLTASGIELRAGGSLIEAARQLVKLIPVIGLIIYREIAYTRTYMIGKAAEVYFFEGVVKSPEEFRKEAEESQKSIEG